MAGANSRHFHGDVLPQAAASDSQIQPSGERLYAIIELRLLLLVGLLAWGGVRVLTLAGYRL